MNEEYNPCPICTDNLIECDVWSFCCEYCQYKESHSENISRYEVNDEVFVLGEYDGMSIVRLHEALAAASSKLV